jgi:cyclopropane fatty-acyl-phospholipid synthase-like methyltransferase
MDRLISILCALIVFLAITVCSVLVYAGIQCRQSDNATLSVAVMPAEVNIRGLQMTKVKPMSAEQAVRYLTDVFGKNDNRLSQTTVEGLLLRDLRPGQTSLHIGTGNSLLPVAEALMGLKVIALDVEIDSISRTSADMREKGIGKTIEQECGGSFEYVIYYGWIPDIKFDHIVAIDFCPNLDEIRIMGAFAGADAFDAIERVTHQEYEEFCNRLCAWTKPQSTLLLSVFEDFTVWMHDQLSSVGITYTKKPVSTKQIWNEEGLFLFNIIYEKNNSVIELNQNQNQNQNENTDASYLVAA